jgi:hypothetical protein
MSLSPRSSLGPYEILSPLGAGGWSYDVSKDGSRFLVTTVLPEDLALPVTLITDWTRRVEGK